MNKRNLILALFLAMCLLVYTGCSVNQNVQTSDEPTEGEKSATNTYKIGVMTMTVSQGEEEYRAAEDLVKEFGEDVIVHRTFPDKASTEQETTISTMLSLAADQDVKAIVACFAVEGTTAAFEKVREVRPDILLIAGAPTEDPNILSNAADFVVGLDYVGMGHEVAQTAKKMGATTLVHYSFPRHMANPIYLARHDVMKDTCKELGIEFVEGTSPDPMGEGGLSSTQQFILEDVPRKIEEYGKETAFFSTNIGMHEPLIKCIYEGGALFPHPDTPSPFYAYPGALGIEVPADKAADANYMVEQISAKLANAGMTGRMGTWLPPMMPLMIKGSVYYAMEHIEGDYTEALDVELLNKTLNNLGGNRITIDKYSDALKNYYVILSETILM
jgi:hypothetical protein